MDSDKEIWAMQDDCDAAVDELVTVSQQQPQKANAADVEAWLIKHAALEQALSGGGLEAHP